MMDEVDVQLTEVLLELATVTEVGPQGPPGPGGVPEAPNDGQIYGRQNETWVVLSSVGPVVPSGSLDFSNPAQSGLIALLEDI
jgi:hypothetical protein